MVTPADGSAPALYTSVFPVTPARTVTVTDPIALARTLGDVRGATFGPEVFDVTGTLVQARDGSGLTDACSSTLNPADLAGNVAFADRGNCAFLDKARNAQAAGARAIVIADTDGPPIGLIGGGDPSVVIPAVLVTAEDGDGIRAQLPAGLTVHLVAVKPFPDRDAALDRNVPSRSKETP
jgi:hypothetical protein